MEVARSFVDFAECPRVLWYQVQNKSLNGRQVFESVRGSFLVLTRRRGGCLNGDRVSLKCLNGLYCSWRRLCAFLQGDRDSFVVESSVNDIVLRGGSRIM